MKVSHSVHILQSITFDFLRFICIICYNNYITIVAPLTSPPINVRSTPGTTSVILQWFQPFLDVVTFYNIGYSRTAGCPDTSSGTAIVNGSHRTHVLMNLQENITYQIYIEAVNSRGNLSADISISTLPAGEFSEIKEIRL